MSNTPFPSPFALSGSPRAQAQGGPGWAHWRKRGHQRRLSALVEQPDASKGSHKRVPTSHPARMEKSGASGDTGSATGAGTIDELCLP